MWKYLTGSYILWLISSYVRYIGYDVLSDMIGILTAIIIGGVYIKYFHIKQNRTTIT